MRLRTPHILIVALALCAITPLLAQEASTTAKRVLWSDPGDIRAKDLFDGPGGKDGRPKPPLKFDKEKSEGSSPKFDVTDAAGEKWHVKMGPEAHSEPVASRLLWAVGYFVNTNYFVHDLHIDDMPARLSRGGGYVDHGNVIYGRVQRKLGKDEKTWDWARNPFRGTREFNGLRVMMALLHNWDLKHENNAYFKEKKTGREIYYVSDVGASFGTTGKSYTDATSKSYLKAFKSGKFIAKVTPEYVDFNFPTHPSLYHVFNVPFFYGSMKTHWIGRKIPRADVRWIASLLSQLSRKQIEDAFRAGGYTADQIQQYTDILQQRIAELAKL